MKVLFCDADGVLNCATTTHRIGGLFGLDPKKIKLVNRICKETGAKIVLSSSWRHGQTSKEALKQAGLNFIDVTPDMPLPGGVASMERGKEIEAWLLKHPEAEQYAILDDDSDMLPDQPLFKTTWQDGLTQEIAEAVIKHLNQ